MQYSFKYKQIYFLNKYIKQIFIPFSFILSKLPSKIVFLTLFLLPYSWNLQAGIGKNNQNSNRSDAILMMSPTITYARPALNYGTHHDGYDGPPDVWNIDKGFLVQSTDPALYGLNFPTTGMDSLYFDLLIEGVDIKTLKWEPVTHSGITATVKTVVAKEWWIPNEDRKLVTRVKLTGPRASYAQLHSNLPSPLTKPNLPQTFELVATDIHGNEVVKYGFELKQWFVSRLNRGECKSAVGYLDLYPVQEAWCRSLDQYRIVKLKDVTNSACKGLYYQCDPLVPLPSATPASSDNHYQRRIGAGFLAEWGNMEEHIGRDAFNPMTYVHNYPSHCNLGTIWTSDLFLGTDFRYWVAGTNGISFRNLPPPPDQIDPPPPLGNALCVTPP